jgi:glyoxylase-like metal-dependent hydrolase (beta-lactamase superfamily II)
MTSPLSDHRDDWTTPGIFEVARGVHRVPLPLPNDGLRAVNVYVLEDPDGLVLVDAGWAVPEGRERLDHALASKGWTVHDITRFLVTHLHRDHLSMAVAIRRETGAPIALGAGEQPSLEQIASPDHRPLEPQLERLRSLGAAHLAERVLAARHQQSPDDDGPEQAAWSFPDQWLGNETIDVAGRTLQIVETPGHTRGHVVFHDEEHTLLFAGDHVLPTITPSIGFEPVQSPNPLGDFLGSLAAVRQRPDATVLPAHGPVSDSVHRRVDELLEHHDRRLAQTEAAVRHGATTAAEAAARLRWTRRERTLDEMDLFNQMLAVAETGAHLILLEAQGRVIGTDDADGVRRYSV